jgi:hypothetical protein
VFSGISITKPSVYNTSSRFNDVSTGDDIKENDIDGVDVLSDGILVSDSLAMDGDGESLLFDTVLAEEEDDDVSVLLDPDAASLAADRRAAVCNKAASRAFTAGLALPAVLLVDGPRRDRDMACDEPVAVICDVFVSTSIIGVTMIFLPAQVH